MDVVVLISLRHVFLVILLVVPLGLLMLRVRNMLVCFVTLLMLLLFVLQ